MTACVAGARWRELLAIRWIARRKRQGELHRRRRLERRVLIDKNVADLAPHQRRSTGRCFVRFAFLSSRSWSFVLATSAGLLASGCASNKKGIGNPDLNSPLASKAE